MTVDLDAIARRGGCEVSSLRNALPLLEQGYQPPFLARYRRDELGGVDEASLWALSAAISAQRDLEEERAHLISVWESTTLADPSLGHTIRKAHSKRILDRLARRLKLEASESESPSDHLAVRLLNPRKGDGSDIEAIVKKVDSIADDQVTAALEGLDDALAKRLAGDPRVINAAVKWLSKQAKINIASISDPHTPGQQESKQDKPTEVAEAPADSSQDALEKSPQADQQHPAAGSADTPPIGSEASSEHEQSSPRPESDAGLQADPTAQQHGHETADTVGDAATVVDDATPAAEPTSVAETPEVAPQESAEQTPKASAEATPEAHPHPGDEKSGGKKSKKMSPRQRRRRWLVSVLKPLAGKRFAANKLSSFQIVMLGRALRSQVAQCSFEYDAAKLVAEIQRAVSAINRQLEGKLKDLVLQHEANIREAAEAAWWDELHERASSRLVGVVADHLRQHINRGCVESKVVMSIDAVGPRTAAVAVVSADGRVLHCEDLPCQLSSSLRSQAVAKMGELIHQHHVDLIVISNGPARRSCMIALGDLITQSPADSVRWTLADRTGADVYSGSAVANQEMRTTPRRFRAAAWLAFSVLQPAQAFAKVDPVKLRLASFQRELADASVAKTLESVVISGASRGGVDVNSAPTEWLSRLPGMTSALAGAIDQQRRKSLLKSREELLELDVWQSVVESRQALPFLRVFGSDQVLDGTLIHPDDYPLAQKLAKSLEIELPPAMPPGYELPTFQPEAPPAPQAALKETSTPEEKPVVEDVSAAAEQKVGDSFAENVEADATGGDATPSEPEAPAADAETGSEGEPAPDAAEPEAASEVATAGPAESEDVADSAAEADATGQPEQAAGQPEQTAGQLEQTDQPGGEETEQSDAAAPQAAPPPEPVRRPRPEQAKIDKCIKEWQIGAKRANQLVSWLCDPFGDSDLSGQPPAVLTSMPSQKTLQPGDEVIGVVVGVMPFGVFVELAPDCSGLIHISKISDKFVEDLHEAIQIGDVITAWVTGIDQKKRRVALSAVSPQREAELQQERSQTRGKSERAPRGQRQRSGGGFRGGDRRGGGRDGGKQSGQAQSRGGRDRSRGRSGDRGRGRDHGGRREKKPESYRVVGKAESTPLSDAMKKGEEPLRSFGDLLQFYSDDEKTTPTEESAKEAKADTGTKEESSADQTTSAQQSTTETAQQETHSADEAATTTTASSENTTSDASAAAPPDQDASDQPPAAAPPQQPSTSQSERADASSDDATEQADKLPTSPDAPS